MGVGMGQAVIAVTGLPPVARSREPIAEGRMPSCRASREPMTQPRYPGNRITPQMRVWPTPMPFEDCVRRWFAARLRRPMRTDGSAAAAVFHLDAIRAAFEHVSGNHISGMLATALQQREERVLNIREHFHAAASGSLGGLFRTAFASSSDNSFNSDAVSLRGAVRSAIVRSTSSNVRCWMNGNRSAGMRTRLTARATRTAAHKPGS